MFDSIDDLGTKLAATGYFIDPVMTQVVFLAAKLQKPLLLEGPAGSGKTQLAVSVAAAARTHIERLQCYRGVTEDKAIGRFDEGLQRLYMEFSKGRHEDWQSVQANLKGRDFFRPGPLMRALECERPCVLLIDELDKVDDGWGPRRFPRNQWMGSLAGVWYRGRADVGPAHRLVEGTVQLQSCLDLGRPFPQGVALAFAGCKGPRLHAS